MATYIDPETGLPFDENGLVDPEISGSASVTARPEDDPDYIDFGDDGAMLAALEREAAIRAGEDPDIEMHSPVQTALEGEAEVRMEGEPPAAAPRVEKSRDAVSASYRGVTPKQAAYAKGVFGDHQRIADQRNAEVEADYAANMQRMDGVFKQRKAAIDEQAAYDQQHLAILQDIRQQERQFQQTAYQLEQMAAQQAQETSAQYIQQYKQDMAGVRQLMQQTGNPLGGMDKASAVGMGLAQFAQGWLAVQGIKIDVSGQIDRWVDREMQAHQQKIANQTNMAQSNLTLYNIARQGAQDEVETRARLRGFLIDGFKTQILQEGDRWGAQSAVADAKAKAAELDGLLLQNDMALQEKVRDQVYKNNMLAVDAAAKQAAASTASYAARTDRLREERVAAKEAADAEAAKNAGTYDGRIVDFTTGKYIATIDENAPQAIVSKAVEGLQKSEEAWRKYKPLMDEYRGLVKQAKKSGWFDKGAIVGGMMSEEVRAARARMNDIVSDMVQAASGLTVTDKEFERRAKNLAPDKMWESGGNEKLIELFDVKMRNNYQASLNSWIGKGARHLRPNEAGAAPAALAPDPVGAAENTIALTSGQGNTAWERDADAVVTSSRNKTTEPTRGWQQLVGAEVKMPEAAKRVETMVLGLLDPDSYRQQSGDSSVPKDNVVLRQALEKALSELGENRNVDAYTQGYAKMLLTQLAEDPQGVYRMLNPRAGVTVELE